MTFPIKIVVVKPQDARGWIGLGCYVLVVILLGMMWADKALLRDDFFKVIATAIILTGWNQGPVGWAYQATKSGGELAASNAETLKQQSAALDGGAPAGTDADPLKTIVVNPPSDPANVQEAKP